MARKAKVMGKSRAAAEAARRAAAAARIGPRQPRTSRPRKPETMFSRNPPGAYYEDWVNPGARLLEEGPEALLAATAEEFGPESSEHDTVRVLVRFGEIYGFPVPVSAARHFDTMVQLSGYATQFASLEGITEGEALDSMHSLHAPGAAAYR